MTPIVNDRSAQLYIQMRPATIRIGVTRSYKDFGEDCWVYHWEVMDMSGALYGNPTLLEGATDLRGPASGLDPGPLAMLRSFTSFLAAAAEGYQAWMEAGLTPENRPESLEGWSDETAEFAYVYADDIHMDQEASS